MQARLQLWASQSVKFDASARQMGSLENGPLKRDRASLFLHRSSRSRFSRFLLFKKLDYLQWICTVAVFLFFVVLFQMFLPGSVEEESQGFLKHNGNVYENVGLGFGGDVEFQPLRLMKKFERHAKDVNQSFGQSRTLKRFGYRKPQLAFVFPDLLVGPDQLLMVTVAVALQEIGYEIQVYSLEGGPVHRIWTNMGVPVTFFQINSKTTTMHVDWLNYDGIILNSLEVKGVLSSLMREPFKSIPIIWAIHDNALAIRSRYYNSSGQDELLNYWKKVFNRASVVVFPNYFLAMIYSPFDAGNYYVIPGSPANTWEVNNMMSSDNNELRVKMGLRHDDVVAAVVGSEFSYESMWVEHALILEALLPLILSSSIDEDSDSQLKVIVLTGYSSTNYSKAVEAIAVNLHYPKGAVKHLATGKDTDRVLYLADLVIYGSFLEEHSFPEILRKAMLLSKPIVAPDLSIIRKYVHDRVNGYIFPKENAGLLTQIMSQLILDGLVSEHVYNVGSAGRNTARNLMVSETVEGYALLLENVLKLPSEVAAPKPASEIPTKLRDEWQWNLFKAFSNRTYIDTSSRCYRFLKEVEEEWNRTQKLSFNPVPSVGESFIYEIWDEQKDIDAAYAIKRREEEELKGRTDQFHATWEDVYRSAKRADRSRNDLHERDEGELLRTGQVLTIYEPYHGEGAWPFLHHPSLYRGIGLSTKGRRSHTDDVDAPSRLPLLSNPYYRDVLGEFGAFFAIANRIDRIHKNAWIGFQSWRASARKASLSKTAENVLLDTIQRRRHGDSLYFWVRMDNDPRNPLKKDFWSFCDSINAGNCRFAFSDTIKRMYGMKPDFNSLLHMPVNGDTWSVMHSWALPTRSFLEFVMFSRMFVDALDAQMFSEHHRNGSCYLSLSKDKHCYSRLLELLVNVWAYHGARKMVYINPETGVMQEHHKLNTRRGHMWIRWFSYTTLKSMDEDLAEEADSDHPTRHWLWPKTGEVFWQGVLEKERTRQRKQREKRKQLSRDKLSRMRRKHRQKAIGKYIKPPPEDTEVSNSTTILGKL